MSKNFITLLFTSSKTEPIFLSASRLYELNVDISGFEPNAYAPVAYPVLKKLQV